jgi:hypothetical protein
VLPAIKQLQSAWEVKGNDAKYALYCDAIKDGLAKLKKYYTWFDEKPSYVLTLGMAAQHICNAFALLIRLYSTSPVL